MSPDLYTTDHHTTATATADAERPAGPVLATTAGRPPRVDTREPGPDAIADRFHYRDLGLTDAEYDRIVAALGRRPNWCEVGMVSVMWSEHCSYRSSRRVLGVLPDVGPAVVKGPGGNAGVVDAGANIHVAFKVESHNHPTAVEPHEGAATGIGGIVRDILAMGARPVALLNGLRFGPIDGITPEHAHNRYLLAGAVAGIGGYGNCIGVPTIGGDTGFGPSYTRNPLVNAMCIGILAGPPPCDHLTTVGHDIWALGASTGRDGIHGATFASTTDPEAAERSAVQVGDPFTGKLLIDGCLELLEAGVVQGLQDMGAAGLTSSLAEMASRGGLGVELDYAEIPRREDGMTACETMLSESQERMVIVAAPADAATIREIAARNRLGCARIGKVIEQPVFRVRENAAIHAELPVTLLVDDAPTDNHHAEPAAAPRVAAPDQWGADLASPDDARTVLLGLMTSPAGTAKTWIHEQYDSQVGGTTLAPPGAAAAGIVLLPDGRALAASLGAADRYVRVHPRIGAVHTVAAVARNLACVGATPLGATDCLNYSTPTDPRVWNQFVESVDGLAEALGALHIPVVSGNVSLYNHTDGIDVDPTPMVGMVGRIDEVDAIPTRAGRPGLSLVHLGPLDAAVLDATLYADMVGSPTPAGVPPIDLMLESRLHDLMRELAGNARAVAADDVSGGGLAMVLARMAIASGCGIEASIPPVDGRADTALFGEAASRIVVAVPAGDVDEVLDAAQRRRVPAAPIGRMGGDALVIDVVDTIRLDVPLTALVATGDALPAVMA